jgi:hypothetical protein
MSTSSLIPIPMLAHLATLATESSRVGTTASDLGAGTLVAAILLTVLTLALAIAFGTLLRPRGGGIANAVVNPAQPKGPWSPVHQLGTPAFGLDHDDFFRVLPEENNNGIIRDGFRILSEPDALTVVSPKCFVCGRPMNEGDHSHLA